MQRVSKAYRLSMQSPLRERGYIKIDFGLLNQEAQDKASVEQGDFAWFSNSTNLFEEDRNQVTYATLEENFTRVDGSMLFLPREGSGTAYMDSGVVSDELVSQAPFEIEMKLNTLAASFKGLTVEFGENYPLDFDIVGEGGQVIPVRDNQMATFVTEDVVRDTTWVRLVFYRMKNAQSRVRIYSIMFGYVLTYTNTDVLDSTLDSFVSPICEDMPTVDFDVTLKNYDEYYTVDNPDSAIHYLETGQRISIWYGYQLPDGGEIEWIRGNTLYLSDWQADDATAMIRGYDVYRTMDGEYYKGTYSPEGVSYYDLATRVLADAGIEDYYLDPRLKNLYTQNPLPRVSHKQALQIIANACRCVLTQSRTGEIEMRSAFIPDAWAESENQAVYSRVAAILDGEPKAEYASLNTNYTVVDGTMYFIPRDLSLATLETGYVSDQLSDGEGKFGQNPMITLRLEAAFMYYGVRLWFGRTTPGAFILRTYKEGQPVGVRRVEGSEIEEFTALDDRFDEFDQMTIEFLSTKDPYNRIVLNNFAFGNLSDLVMTRNDMIDYPKAIKQELVKEVIVSCYSYQGSETEEILLTEDVTAEAGEERIYYVDSAHYNYRITINEEAGDQAEVVESGSYYVVVRFNGAGDMALRLYAYPYQIVEQRVKRVLNARGKTVEWENPLISDMEMAGELAQWLGDHYQSEVEYQYTTRGNPELDTGDMIYQQNDHSGENQQVRVYRQRMKFGGAFGGSLAVRRMEG